MIAKIVAAALVLDLIFADPHSSYHPVALIGRLITALEKLLLKEKSTSTAKRLRGAVLIAAIIGTVFTVVEIVYLSAKHIKYGPAVFSTLLIWASISPRALGAAGLKIAELLKAGDLGLRPKSTDGRSKLRRRPKAQDARQTNAEVRERTCKYVTETRRRITPQIGFSVALLDQVRGQLSHIVSRDTEALDASQIAQGAIESIAENSVDALIAPIFYALIGGPVAAIIYRAVNTADSMVGYKNDKYIDFGRAAARLDDLLNYIPARVSPLLIALAALFSRQHFTRTFRTSQIYGRNHPSPNSGIAQAAMAGALGRRLGGPIFYNGKKRFCGYLGEGGKPEASDIVKAVRLLYFVDIILLVITLAAAVVSSYV